MKNRIHSLLITAVLSVIFSCATNTAWHSAKPLKANEQIGYYGVSAAGTDAKDSVNMPESNTVFPLEYSAAYAINEHGSFRINYIFPISIGGGLKFQWNKNRSETGFFISQELNIGSMSLLQILFNQDDEESDYDDTDEEESSLGVFEVKLPTYFSYYPMPNLGLTLAPAYILRYYNEDSWDNIPKHFSNLLGLHSNIQIGTTSGLCFELSTFKNFYTRNIEYQAGLAFFIKKLNTLTLTP